MHAQFCYYTSNTLPLNNISKKLFQGTPQTMSLESQVYKNLFQGISKKLASIQCFFQLS